MASRDREPVDTNSDLQQLREFLSSQHDNFIEVLQEPLDNAVSATVENEAYFRDPDPFTIQLTFIRNEETVTVIVADSGKGMNRDVIRESVFSTADVSHSEGILNNMGAGLKASIAWTEESVELADGPHLSDNAFHLLSRDELGDTYHRVDGPIPAGLEVFTASDEDFWTFGAEELSSQETGTRVHLTCARGDFDDDVHPRASSLNLKIKYLEEWLGVHYRDLLSAHDDTEIILSYKDVTDGDDDFTTTTVTPIYPIFFDAPGRLPEDVGILPEFESRDAFEEALREYQEAIENDAEYVVATTTIEGETGVQYDIAYEHGEVDIEASVEAIDADGRGLTTSGDPPQFRWRYRRSRNRNGADVYGNGRILNTSEWIYDKDNHTQHNGFVASLHIVPRDPEQEVPTSNDKTSIKKQSALWRKIKDWIASDDKFDPIVTYDEGSQSSSEETDSDSDDTTAESGDDTDASSTAEEETADSDTEERSTSEADTGGSAQEADTDSTEGTTSQRTEGLGDDGETTVTEPTSTDDGDSDSSADSEGDSSDEATTGAIDLRQSVLDVLRTRDSDADFTVQAVVADVTIDILQDEGDTAVLYRIVDGAATPDHIYDLMMYQDHYKRDHPEKYDRTVLICRELSEAADEDLGTASGREDEHQDSYRLMHDSSLLP